MFDQGNLVEKLDYMTRSPFELVNCTISYFSGQWNIGSRLPDGSYDGMIGMMVNGEANSTALAYVLGSMDDEPVIPGPVWTSTEMAILSRKFESTRDKHGPEGWLNNFDVLVYVYTLICLILFATYYIMSDILNDEKVRMKTIEDILKNGKIKLKTIERKILKDHHIRSKYIKSARLISFKCLTSFIRVESFSTPSIKHTFIVLALNVGLFILIQAIFLGLTSTEMIADQPVPIIDQLDDLLFGAPFKHMEVGIPGGLWQSTILNETPSDTLEGQLWNRVKYHLPIRVDKLDTVINVLNKGMDKLFRYESVLVVDKTIISAFKSIICQTRGLENGSKVHISRGSTFAERLITFSTSKSSDQKLVEWINYRQNLLLQSGLTKNWVASTSYYFIMDQSSSYQSIVKCLDGEEQDQNDPQAVGMEYFFGVIILIIYISIIFTLILFIERKFECYSKLFTVETFEREKQNQVQGQKN